jgi:hypothetical protein
MYAEFYIRMKTLHFDFSSGNALFMYVCNIVCETCFIILISLMKVTIGEAHCKKKHLMS